MSTATAKEMLTDLAMMRCCDAWLPMNVPSRPVRARRGLRIQIAAANTLPRGFCGIRRSEAANSEWPGAQPEVAQHPCV